MQTSLPSDVLNIIFEYYSQLCNMKWTPFIETHTGKLKWKVNKHCEELNQFTIDFYKYRQTNEVNILFKLFSANQAANTFITTGNLVTFRYKKNNKKRVWYFQIHDSHDSSVIYSSFVIIKDLVMGVENYMYCNGNIFGIVSDIYREWEHMANGIQYEIHCVKY